MTKAKLTKDIDIAIELLKMLKDSTQTYESNNGYTNEVNFADIKRTRITINKLLTRNEKQQEEQ